MRKKFKNAARLIVVFMILATFTKCQKDDDLGQANDKTLLSAKQWFKNYETEGSNYELFQNLDYNWNDAEITNSEDGTKTIIVPINEIKKDPTENWEQKLYIYKLGTDNYQALLFEIYPDKNNTDPNSSLIESGIFTGYISVGDIKKGFLKAAKFENGKLVENGIINLRSKSITGKAPSNQVPCPVGTDCDTDISGGAIDLKEVVVNNNYQNPGTGYIIIYNNSGGGYTGDTTGTYTNHGTGTGTAESGDNANYKINSLTDLKNVINSTNDTGFDIQSQQKANQVIATVRFNILPWAGITILINQNIDKVYKIDTVTSTASGLTAGFTWSQNLYSQNTIGNITTLNVNGTITYGTGIQGIGNMYSQPVTYEIKLNNTNGEIISGKRLSLK